MEDAATVASRAPIFRLPVSGASLIYAPLHGVAAVVGDAAARRLGEALGGGRVPAHETLRTIAARLRAPPGPGPRPRSGPLTDPLFLGIIPTRGCNMACGYCDFAAPKTAGRTMSLELARASVDAYLALLGEAGRSEGQVHFFGGEPFRAADVVEHVVEYARLRASAFGVALHLEATTNGLFGAGRARWVADRFGTIVLSLDGPPEIQDRQRPLLNGRPSFEAVLKTARILSAGPVGLIVRSCVTADTVDGLPDWAAWVARELRPGTVCLESLTPSPASSAAGLFPPDPYRYARGFAAAARVLEAAGIRAVQSTTDLDECRISACPVGRDALIVSPNGVVDGCYLLEGEWRGRGLDLRLGRVDTERRRLEVEAEALERVRRVPAREKPLCANCFCRYHCAGGCHVHHDTSRPAGSYDDLCVATRLIAADKLLRRLGLPRLADELLADTDAAGALARLPDDHLVEAADG